MESIIAEKLDLSKRLSVTVPLSNILLVWNKLRKMNITDSQIIDLLKPIIDGEKYES